MNNIEVYTNLLAEGFKDDPGIKAQLANMKNGFKYFKAQAKGEVEAYYKSGLLTAYGNGEGMLLGCSTEKFKDEEFIKCIQEGSKYLLAEIPKEDLVTMTNNANKVAKISDSNWFLKYVPNREVYVLQVAVVKEGLRGKGIFKKMISGIIDKCDEKNIPIVLQTHNPKNVKIYEHLGFKLMEEVKSEELNLTCYNFIKFA